MKLRKNFVGFTLIELIVVIVILGVLSVSAAPKFVSLQSDARVATLQGLKGAIKSTDTGAYAKALIHGINLKQGWVKDCIDGSGKANETSCVDVDGVYIHLKYGHLDRAYIWGAMDADLNDTSYATISGGSKKIKQAQAADKTCSSLNANDVCDHDYCQCQLSASDKLNSLNKIGGECQAFTVKGMTYSHLKPSNVSEGCAFVYCSATANSYPNYILHTDGC